jgi:hypothetical protein
VLAANTSMRPVEVNHLSRRDVDLVKSLVYIRIDAKRQALDALDNARRREERRWQRQRQRRDER